MRDFARYVILSPVMSAMAAPAMARTVPLDQSGNPFRDFGNFGDADTPGLDGKPSPSEVVPLGPFVRRSRIDS